MSLRKITVHPGTQLVEHVRGTFSRVLEPGQHRRPRKATYLTVPTRTQVAHVAVQEVPTADGLTVRVSAAIRWTLADARRFVEVAEAPLDVVYLAVQVALRDAVASVAATEAITRLRVVVPDALRDAARATGAEVGVDVAEVVVKDVLLPVELRSAQAELVTARARGQAELEKARAETAALRSLANAAKLLDDHPALAQLRLVQALPYGASVKLTVE
ncbi:MAG: slipin family protein [Nocardioidaceae bacterium]|nr:slipin family protein [Nocardioidaceae bacterium]